MTVFGNFGFSRATSNCKRIETRAAFLGNINSDIVIVNTHLPPSPLINVVMDLVMIFKVTSNNIEMGKGIQKCIKVFHLFSRVRFQLVIQFFRRMSQHSQKLSFYYTFKNNYSLSAYLDLTRKNPSRKSLEKLRISSHKLRIETGRYDKIPRDERLCSLCNCNRIEDETHFLQECPSYSSIRDRFFSKIELKIPFLRLLSHETLLSHLMNCTDYFINIQLISFISS